MKYRIPGKTIHEHRKVIGKHLDTPIEFVPFQKLNAVTIKECLFKE